MPQVSLKKGKEKAVRQLHPWIFSGAIENIKGKPENGEIVDVTDHSGAFLARGFFNDQSRVAVRILEWNEDVVVDETWWRARIKKAVSARQSLLDSTHTNTYRLIFSEADFLPGLIVDRYGDYLSLQLLTSGIEKLKDVIVDELVTLLQVKGIFDRSDASARAHDGMEASFGILYGAEPPEFVEVIENDVKYLINIAAGQKSGFFCDQRDNRRIVAQHAKGKRVLDCFSYSGGFTLNALKYGASSVVSVDSSALAIETMNQNIVLNGFDASQYQAIQSDVNKYLRVLKEGNEKFDVIVLDPPKYAPSRSSLDKASRAYKDLNRMAMGLLNSGGILATFSCSGAVDISHFKQILAWAALDAGKEIQYIYQFCQPEDHPVRSSFPEGEYLKGLLCRVV
ncbi:LSU m5C1962 methyltransferase RlmI [Arcticibacter svalbardensis MN12-7]|uniref:LSU m5C1962 methyltransferase RlmI n=1 Tax=Arcticibacter svalbardensis MN12-7 TaxID=1150600 RepID=R9GT72_9SPHI|nr:class I SAM-dependent rRNA methyltransferase [Arcticibacter svalbardensis]EOR94730.1 LSU m5C1962 methyltransferase RlmI [Arcticibacter svalbardensis MN12-7]